MSEEDAPMGSPKVLLVDDLLATGGTAEAGLLIRKRGLLTPIPLSPQHKNVTSHSKRNQNPKPNVRVGPECFY